MRILHVTDGELYSSVVRAQAWLALRLRALATRRGLPASIWTSFPGGAWPVCACIWK
jgi:hypothetical protein